MEKTKTFSKAGLLGYFVKGSVGFFVACIAASIVMTALNTVIPKIIGFTIDSVLGDIPVPDEYGGIVGMFGGVERLKRDIWIVALVTVGIALVTLIFRYCSTYFNHRADNTLMRRMRNTLFTHIQRLPLSWHSKNNTGDIIQRCTSDADTISNFVSGQLVSLVRIMLLLTLSLVFMFTTDVRLAAIASAFIPPIIGYSLFYFFKAHKAFKTCDEQEGVLSTYAQENLTGVRVVRAFGCERYERDKFEKQNSHYTGLWVRLNKFMALYWTSSDFIVALQLLFIIVLGTLFCVRGGMTAGDLVAFISYNTMMMGPVRQLGRIISNLSKANVSLGRLAEVMNAEEEVYGEDEGALAGDIVFENVGFEYEAGKPVLRGVSFAVPQGTTLGIVGGTGSGKSTVACLMDGLYGPTSGRITIGGRDIKDIPPATLRRNVGFVMQEGYIYSRTIAENIAIAARDGSAEKVAKAAATACLDGNVEGFANGYETVVGERGVTLSGGQKQRVAIARTIIRETPYMIFDDSLSAVDSDTDARIRAHLRKECKGVTTVIIAHRLTTVMHADNIIVMDGGRIAEHGSHKELLERDGIYKRIYDVQLSLPDELKEEAEHAR